MKKMMVLSMMLFLTCSVGGCAAAPKSQNAPERQSTIGKDSLQSDQTQLGEGKAMAEEAAEYQKKSAVEGEFASGESYLDITDNQKVETDDNSLITFSLKVDTSAYNNIERYLENGTLPPKEAVKTEELINYFSYEQKLDFQDGSPFAIAAEIGTSPFDASKKLAFVRVKTRDLDLSQAPSSNLTFLIDTSGSMNAYNKLPLLKEAFGLLVETLTEEDRVSIVTYAGSSNIILDSVSGAEQERILKALDELTAGGSTAGAEGILTAYELAEKNYQKGGNNRIILATDGDFNVGLSNLDELETLVSQKRESGIYFSILGFGTGNLKDDKIETLAKNGNGNYSYINSVSAANKVLVEERGSNLFVVAEDVKAQIEFNPQNIKNYRLLGYENRMLENEDFEDDQKDAGEIGIGTDVVVLLEFEMQSNTASATLKYQDQQQDNTKQGEYSNELFEIRIRYKNPGESESQLLLIPATVDQMKEKNSSDYNFAAAVAGFAHLLRGSDATQALEIGDLLELTESNLGKDEGGYRYQFYELLTNYQNLMISESESAR